MEKNYAKELKAPVFSRATQDAAQKGACEKKPFSPTFQAPSQNTGYMQDSGLGWEVVVAWGAKSGGGIERDELSLSFQRG